MGKLMSQSDCPPVFIPTVSFVNKDILSLESILTLSLVNINHSNKSFCFYKLKRDKDGMCVCVCERGFLIFLFIQSPFYALSPFTEGRPTL